MRLYRAQCLEVLQDLGGQANELAGTLDEAVSQERVDRLAIKALEQPRLGGDLSQQ
jgi:hypothetical protein